MIRTVGWRLALGFLAIACTDPQVAEPTERTWDGAFLIDAITIACDGVQAWTYDVRTLGWGDAVTVDIVARSPGYPAYVEHHSLPEVEHGEDWARHYVELDQGFGEQDYAPSETTAIACQAKTLVTYGFAAWRYDGDMEECVAWGIDPVGEFPECTSWGENGHTL